MDPIKLTNVSTSFEFNGTKYEVKKATLQQVIQFQRKVAEISAAKDAGGDLLMAAYAIWIILNAQDKNITEQEVLDNCPGDINVTEVFLQLGFMSQQKVDLTRRVQAVLATQPPKEETKP
jgi:hypothetical protein